MNGLIFCGGRPRTARLQSALTSSRCISNQACTSFILLRGNSPSNTLIIPTVELSYGTLGGQPVAQAILSDGRLWGRILTSTGVNLGGGGMVAGVRRTSVSVARTPAMQAYTISIIDSQSPGGTAATITNTNGANPNTISVSSGTLLTYTSGSTVIPTPIHKTKTEFLTAVTDATWIRTNTLTDIDHLVDLSGSVDLIATTHTRVMDEIAATVPRLVDTAALGSLCASTAVVSQ